MKAGRERIVQLAMHKYNLTLPKDSLALSNNTLSPVNINGVVEIVRTMHGIMKEKEKTKQLLLNVKFKLVKVVGIIP